MAINGQSFLLKPGVNKATGELIRSNTQVHAIKLIESLPHEQPWLIQVHPFKAKGTEQQNRYFHLIVSEIAVAESVPAPYKKECLKAEFGPIIGEHLGKTLLKSWGEYTKQERSDLISHVQVYAAERGIELTQPDE